MVWCLHVRFENVVFRGCEGEAREEDGEKAFHLDHGEAHADARLYDSKSVVS